MGNGHPYSIVDDKIISTSGHVLIQSIHKSTRPPLELFQGMSSERCHLRMAGATLVAGILRWGTQRQGTGVFCDSNQGISRRLC